MNRKVSGWNVCEYHQWSMTIICTVMSEKHGVPFYYMTCSFGISDKITIESNAITSCLVDRSGQFQTT